MTEDTIHRVACDVHDLAASCESDPMTRFALEGIANRLETIEAAGTGALPKIEGAQPRRDWLELPRNITLKRFVNTRRRTYFIGQYTDANPASGDTNPRRIYTIDVVPLGAEDLAAAGLPPVFEVAGRVDGHLLFKIVTRHGRAVAEYLGVKALKAWLNYSGSRRRGKQSLKNHHKRYRANKRARKSAVKNED